MPILFKPVTECNGLYDIDLVDNLQDSVIDESVNYTESIINGMRAAYEAAKGNSYEIISEGFTDMMISLKQWFVDWLRKFKAHIGERFMKIQKYLKYLLFTAAKSVKFKGTFSGDFKVKGYEYDFNDKLNAWCINDMISRVEKAVNRVENAKSDIGQALTQSLTEVGSIELLDKYRGSLVGKNAVSQREYFDELDMLFRKGKRKPIDITINETFISRIHDKADELKREMNELYKERNILENNVSNIIAFLNKRPKFLVDNNKKDKIVNGEYISAHEVNNAIISVYSRSAASLKTTLLICEQYYNHKMSAISEALSFYSKCANKAFAGKVHESSIEVVNDYTEMVEEETMYLNDEYESDCIDEATLELFVYCDAWEAKQEAISEAANGKVKADINNRKPTERRVRGFGNRLADLVRRFIEFIGNMISKFSQAVEDILSTDIEYLRKNAHYITDIPADVLNSLTLNYSNYMHTAAHQRIMETKLPDGVNLDAIVGTIGKAAVDSRMTRNQNFNAAKECYKRFFPTLVKIDPDNWKNAALLYYRGIGKNIPKTLKNNSGQGETVTARGNECAQVLSEMLKYCLNYKNYANAAKSTVNNVKNAISKQQQYIDRLMQQKSQFNSAMNEGYAVPYSQLEDVYTHIVHEELGATSISPKGSLGNGGNANGTVARPANQNTNSNTGTAIKNGPSENNEVRPSVIMQQNQKNNNANNTTQNQNNKDSNNEAKRYVSDKANELIDTTAYAAEQIKTAYTVCVSIASAKLTVCEEIMKSYMRVLRGVVDEVRKYNGNVEEDRENTQYNQDQEDKAEADYQAKRQDIKRRNQLRADRRTGLFGKLKNFFIGA